MSTVDTEWEEFPSYLDLIRIIPDYIKKLFRTAFIDNNKSADFRALYFNISRGDVLLVIIFAVMWTALRHLATEKIFKPLGQHYALTPAYQRKMPESAWKAWYLLCVCSYTIYVVILSGKYRFLQKPSTMLQNWTMDILRTPLPTDIYFMYVAQSGFCIHSMYATVFMDTWKKDSNLMMAHHVLHLSLIYISYILRFHNYGCLVWLTHDTCEIFLEFAKLCGHFRWQNGKLMKTPVIIGISFFICFLVTWYLGRLYCYPLRVLYPAMICFLEMQFILPGRVYLLVLINCLMWSLQILDIYWTISLTKLISQYVTGRIEELDDIREYDVHENSKMPSKNV